MKRCTDLCQSPVRSNITKDECKVLLEIDFSPSDWSLLLDLQYRRTFYIPLYLNCTSLRLRGPYVPREACLLTEIS